ncbi:MaoC/PaaZ C-terminal domain-containing protein [Venatoribacter cucullus]|uniref:MaoC/PaaZ C-terminal domain-containing protein n=1 Tax=Venatoribacter cucullus TaxID=2661630 RepID=UPI00223FD545|nr:MaoC/PaaZ C-terminal domain-containing protein [Venatoribacter cucullus]UZK03251.1 hypothetical protein GAY96_04695 [Venatoribacter cucullus]
MTDATRLHFQDTPGLLSQYGRALLARPGKTSSPHLPGIEAWQTSVRADADKVAAYARVCGFNPDAPGLPITYPHILAFPLHMELMLHKDFPLALMGLVHIRNHITQHRTIQLSDKLDICCRFNPLQETDKGLEFDICTEISCGGEIVWESVSTNLARHPRSSQRRTARVRPAPASFSEHEDWELASNLGRRYARVSGDSNPIHLFTLSARLFGFPRHIAHGMWSKARTAATLMPLLNSERCSLSCDFRLPLFLPASAVLHWNPPQQHTPASTHFELRSSDGHKTHLQGRVFIPDTAAMMPVTTQQ